ncbi:MAG: hypothetical protein LBJ95_00980 [Oscillospiraceae bacterium]|nr:hypothetical protein [Oscillospiraceae bacterium]
MLLTTLLLAVIPTRALSISYNHGDLSVTLTNLYKHACILVTSRPEEYVTLTILVSQFDQPGTLLLGFAQTEPMDRGEHGEQLWSTSIFSDAGDYRITVTRHISGNTNKNYYLYYFGSTTQRINGRALWKSQENELEVTLELGSLGHDALEFTESDTQYRIIDKIVPIVKLENTGQTLVLKDIKSRDADTNTVVATYSVNGSLVGKNLQIQFETEGENFILKSPVVTVQVQADTSAEELTVPDKVDTSKVPYGPFDSTCRPHRIDPLCIAPAVVKGYVLPERCNPDVVNLLAIPLYPSCEFSFVARLFGAVGGKTDLLAETHTPWSQQNGVAIRKPLAESRVLGRTWIQYVVYTRNLGSKGQVVEYQFN